MLSILDISTGSGPWRRSRAARSPSSAGRMLGFLGPNGAGKTTTMRLRRAIYALVRFAGRVCAHGLLHGGSQLGIHAAWRLARQH